MPDVSDTIDVIETWRLPLDFYSLTSDEQWKAMAAVTVPAKKNLGTRQPCAMSAIEQAQAILFMLLVLGVPLAIVPATMVLCVPRNQWLLKYWFSILGVLSFHPLPTYSLKSRRRQIGLIMARYFSFNVVVDRSDPLQKHIGTPNVDQIQAPFPVAPLACPHGVLNFGAMIWVYLDRWMTGQEQYSAGAQLVNHVPGLRYLVEPLWFVNVDRKSLKKHFQERPTTSCPRGGVVGIVPDGIAGIFHSKPGTDVLHLGKKRGLMRIGLEEGVSFFAAWFAGTTDCFTIVQDPFGLMQCMSRKLGVSIFLFFGRWGLPVPRRSPTTVIMNITTLQKKESPTAEDIDKAHHEVYGSLLKQFERLKHFACLSDRTLVVT